MGVSGAGKSTVAQELAARLGWAFEEGDALHPEANVAKMHAGIPLTDADRQPWLESVAAWIDAQRAASSRASSLARRSSGRIAGSSSATGRKCGWSIFAAAAKSSAEHLAGRSGHFMPASLLQSQIDTLEEPGPDEDP